MDRCFRSRPNVVFMIALITFGWCLSGTAAADDGFGDAVTDRELYCPTSVEAARLAFNHGRRLADEGELEVAKKSYFEAIQADSQFCDAMDNLGLVYRHLGDLDSAIYWYLSSLAIEPFGYVAHMNLAVAYRQQRRHSDAAEEYRRCIFLDSLDPEGYYGLGSLFLDSGQYRDALPLFIMCDSLYSMQSSPYVLHARYFQGICYASLEEWTRGIDVLTGIYKDVKGDAGANYCLGLCYLRKDPSDRKEAVKYLKQAKKLGSKRADDLLKEID